MTPSSVTESWVRIWRCCSGGKTSTMRSMVWAASVVWTVEKTRWPVSAAVIASWIVSRSRISPTRITSGFWRMTCLRASANECVSWPSSRWLMARHLVIVHELDRVLDGHDMGVPVRVDVVDDGGQRRALAGAGRPGDEQQAARAQGDLLGRPAGHHEVVNGLDGDGDDAHDGADVPLLPEDVDAEPGEVGGIGHVQFQPLGEAFAPLLVHDRKDQPLACPRR